MRYGLSQRLRPMRRWQIGGYLWHQFYLPLQGSVWEQYVYEPGHEVEAAVLVVFTRNVLILKAWESFVR